LGLGVRFSSRAHACCRATTKQNDDKQAEQHERFHQLTSDNSDILAFTRESTEISIVVQRQSGKPMHSSLRERSFESEHPTALRQY
jgi:hypothetical protein